MTYTLEFMIPAGAVVLGGGADPYFDHPGGGFVVGSSCCILIENAKDFEEYKEILENIITLAHHEAAVIRKGGISDWYLVQLESVVLPEMVELLQYVLEGCLFLKYGRNQRLLESTYILTDSPNAIGKTPLGIQLTRLQDKINSQK